MKLGKGLALATFLLLISLASRGFFCSEPFSSNHREDERDSLLDSNSEYYSALEGLFGQVAKTVVYGTAGLKRINNRLLCPLLKHETDKQNQDQPILIYADDEITPWITNVAEFNSSQMTIIFVHGWLGGINNEFWLVQAKNKILELSESLATSGSETSFKPNIIIVEWSDFSTGSLYAATQNSLKVSHRLGNLLRQLAQVGGLKPELMHCMGHSIGAHICGQAARLAFPVQGNDLNKNSNDGSHPVQKMGRITGLDPGGFCYELGINNETTYSGLKPSDAFVVDAYYSNRSPYGNKYKVAHYNVRINNGFFQANCSVWKNPEVAVEYFKAAVGFTIGNTANNDVLACDHYFATKFAYLMPGMRAFVDGYDGPTCSYMAYKCNSYRNFKRGRCGLCNSISDCYPMDFEYQKPEGPSIEAALNHLQRYSTIDSTSQLDDEQSDSGLAGSVKMADRLVYYMRIPSKEPFCNPLYRLRVDLNPKSVDLSNFRNSWLQIKFFHSQSNQSNPIQVRDLDGGQVGQSPGLHGPWPMEPEERQRTGAKANTLTAMFEPDEREPQKAIKSLIVVYNNRLNTRQDPFANPIELIHLDYLSSTNEKLNNC